jgi:hypothetical protein
LNRIQSSGVGAAVSDVPLSARNSVAEDVNHVVRVVDFVEKEKEEDGNRSPRPDQNRVTRLLNDVDRNARPVGTTTSRKR